MVIFIDNGHGIETPGKRSPDGSLREFAYTREVARRVVSELKSLGFDARLLVPEDTDIPLQVRCDRVNAVCRQVGKGNVLCVSIHCNAAGNGDWMRARGWSAYTSIGNTISDTLATSLYKEAMHVFKGQKIRTDKSDGDLDWEANFKILRSTNCACVLTENFFMDNKEDVKYLLSEEGKCAIVDVHVNGIVNFINR